MATQRAFFDKLAKKFNIQQPEDWYKISVRMVLEEKGTFITKYYNGSLTNGKGI
jgi:hypothetical protein